VVRQLVYFHNIQFLVARSATTAGGLFVTMAIHSINLAEVTQGIADYVVRLGRALTSSELYEFIYDHIIEKYPNATMGEVSNLHRVVREAIANQTQAHTFEQDQQAKRRAKVDQFRKAYSRNPFDNDQQDYSFSFTVNPETFKRMTEDPQPNYADYVAVPGWDNWSAPSSYNKFHGGNGGFKYCRPFNIKGRHWNVNRFELIPFKFIPSSLCL
jgi:hypothetical protein